MQIITYKMSTKLSPHSKVNLALQVCLRQNVLTAAQRNITFEITPSNHYNFYINCAPRVRLTQSQLAIVFQKSVKKASNNHIIKTEFAFHTYLQSNHALAANNIHSTLPNNPQIAKFASRNTNQASLAHQNPLKFNKLKLSNLSIKFKSHIPN